MVRVALVGCGAVARLYYAPALRELEARSRLSVVAVADPNSINAAQVRAQFPAATVARDVREVLTHGIDLAIVASPHSMHAEHSIQLLNAGVSVLCEKPMATSVADAQAMIDAAASASGILAIGMSRRFLPATQTIRRLLALNVLGEITSFNFAEGDASFLWPVASPGYFRRMDAHGGVLLDIGIHALDLMLWWLGEPIEIVYEDDAMGGIEVNCRIRCTFSQGAVGEVRLSRDCALANRYTLRGTKGWLSWTVNQADGFELGFENADHVLKAALQEAGLHESGQHKIGHAFTHAGIGKPALNFEQSFVSQLSNVIGAMSNTDALLVSASEGIAAVRLIEHCYRNRKLMPMPWLSQSEVLRGTELNVAPYTGGPAPAARTDGPVIDTGGVR
ncbi:MAG: Gfo/Idh/MocA family protein [Steroidobacteraceae bacterium]